MKISEKSFSEGLRLHLRRIGLTVTSFQNCGVPSVPDLYLLNRRLGKAAWLELKVATLPHSKVIFEPGQVDWLESHCAGGTGALLLVYCQSNDHVFIFNGSDAGRVQVGAWGVEHISCASVRQAAETLPTLLLWR